MILYTSNLNRADPELIELVLVYVLTGWKQAFNNAQSAQFILACDVNKEQPDAISWCVRADSKSVLRDERGFVYYKIAGVPRAKPTE